MGKFVDLRGEKFGRLTVIERAENGSCCGKATTRWSCMCECGKQKTVEAHSLLRGRTKSCGCLNEEVRVKNLVTIKHGGCYTRMYHIYAHMKGRCLNKNDSKYKDYGGRGIRVCEEWSNDFNSFRDWAINAGYSETLTLDRIDVNGNYEPNNCRWADWRTQRMNQRRMLNVEKSNDKAKRLSV